MSKENEEQSGVTQEMPKYLGVKVIHAVPMIRGLYLGAQSPNQAISKTTYNEEGYKVVYPDGYVSWSPKEAFEKAYKPLPEEYNGLIIDVDPRDGSWRYIQEDDSEEPNPAKMFSFGIAIEKLKLGFKVSRSGWNGKCMYLFLNSEMHSDYLKNNLIIQDFACKMRCAGMQDGCTILPSICMKTADNKILIGWLASQSDMLSEDWIIAV